MSDFCLPLLMLLPVLPCPSPPCPHTLIHCSKFRSKMTNQDQSFLCVLTIPHTHLYHRANNVLPYLFTNLFPLLDSKLLEVRQFLVFDNPNTRHWAGPIADAPQAWWISLQKHSIELTTFTSTETIFSLAPYDIFCFFSLLPGCFFLVYLLSPLLLLDF